MRIGLVDLDTSHPKAWVPVIRELGHEVSCVFDGGAVYPDGYAQEFAAQMKVPKVAKSLDEMVGLVDAAVIHSCNWDLHVERARVFVDAGLPVLIDKPMVGCVRDARTLADWAKRGRVIAGGSSLRYAYETAEIVFAEGRRPEEIHLVHCGCGVDEFNYGIHAFSHALGIMGPGVASVRRLGGRVQESCELTWSDGRRGIVTVGETKEWLPSYATVVTGSKVLHVQPDVTRIYRALLEHDLPILAGQAKPMDILELLEPEMAAIASLASKRAGGRSVRLDELSPDGVGYDGAEFARAYRAVRLPKYLESRKS